VCGVGAILAVPASIAKLESRGIIIRVKKGLRSPVVLTLPSREGKE